MLWQCHHKIRTASGTPEVDSQAQARAGHIGLQVQLLHVYGASRSVDGLPQAVPCRLPADHAWQALADACGRFNGLQKACDGSRALNSMACSAIESAETSI